MIPHIVIWTIIGAVNGLKDKSALNVFRKSYWNKGQSWTYKWKVNEFGLVVCNREKKWYYLWLYAPPFKERFPYSSTMLVFLTDGWHLLQFIQFKLAILSVVLHNYPLCLMSILHFFVLVVCFSVGFWVTYEKK